MLPLIHQVGGQRYIVTTKIHDRTHAGRSRRPMYSSVFMSLLSLAVGDNQSEDDQDTDHEHNAYCHSGERTAGAVALPVARRHVVAAVLAAKAAEQPGAQLGAGAPFRARRTP